MLENYYTILKQILAKYVTLKVVKKFLPFSQDIQIRRIARKNGEDEMVLKGSTLHFVSLNIIWQPSFHLIVNHGVVSRIETLFSRGRNASDYNSDSVTSENQSVLKFCTPRKTWLRRAFVSLQSNGDLTSCSTRFALNNFVFGYKEPLLSHSDTLQLNMTSPACLSRPDFLAEKRCLLRSIHTQKKVKGIWDDWLLSYG